MGCDEGEERERERESIMGYIVLYMYSTVHIQHSIPVR